MGWMSLIGLIVKLQGLSFLIKGPFRRAHNYLKCAWRVQNTQFEHQIFVHPSMQEKRDTLDTLFPSFLVKNSFNAKMFAQEPWKRSLQGVE